MKCSGPMMIKNPAFAGQKASLNKNHHQEDRVIPVRCGKCEGCLKSNINSWSFRLLTEAKQAKSVAFVTLTYDPLYVPLTKTHLPTLNKKDVQNYIKRLRKSHSTANIKYFAVGEYGSRSYRPHYHIILFNAPTRKAIEKHWNKGSDPLGNIHIGDNIDSGAIPYTLKYMYKKGLIPRFDGDDRLPEFRIMSKKLGQNYLTPAMIKWHLADLKNRQYAIFDNGIKIGLPRYYREKLIELSGKPKSFFRMDNDPVYMTREDNDYRTLESRVQNQKTRQNLFEKKRNQEQRKKL